MAESRDHGGAGATEGGMGTRWLGKRRLHRTALKHYLEVRDRDSDELVARVLDINIAGMRLISDRPLPLQQRFRLSLVVPAEDGRASRRIKLDAESVWSERDVNDEFFDTGFRLIDPSAEVRAQIESLLRKMSADG